MYTFLLLLKMSHSVDMLKVVGWGNNSGLPTYGIQTLTSNIQTISLQEQTMNCPGASAHWGLKK